MISSLLSLLFSKLPFLKNIKILTFFKNIKVIIIIIILILASVGVGYFLIKREFDKKQQTIEELNKKIENLIEKNTKLTLLINSLNQELERKNKNMQIILKNIERNRQINQNFNKRVKDMKNKYNNKNEKTKRIDLLKKDPKKLAEIENRELNCILRITLCNNDENK
jgi:uncharacterized protein YoxC